MLRTTSAEVATRNSVHESNDVRKRDPLSAVHIAALDSESKGKPLPGLAQVAMQGGTRAAKAILRKGKVQPKFPPFEYFNKGALTVIGHAAAHRPGCLDRVGCHTRAVPLSLYGSGLLLVRVACSDCNGR